MIRSRTFSCAAHSGLSLDRAMSNWENPMRGAPDLVEEVLANVLDACAKGNTDKYSNLLSSIWSSNLTNVSWISKSKYPPMVVLMPRIGVEKVKIT